MPSRGYKQSEEHRKKISDALLGIHRSKETREKVRRANLGKVASEETRKKMSESHIGTNTWTKGTHQTLEHINYKRARNAGFNSFKEYKRFYPKKCRYKAEVWVETRKSLRTNPPLPNSEKRGRSGVRGAYQLDHIISIDEGFKRHISPKRIGAYKNLQIITWEENIAKGTR